MEKRYFCALFDSNYLIKGIAMLQSLFRNCPDAHVHVLCMDEQVQNILVRLGMESITCIPLHDLEDDTLRAVKNDRSVAEYCWTLSPCLPWHILKHNPRIDFITYLDADLLFYSQVQPIFDEINDSSIAIIEHRFTPRLQDRIVNGRFCVEWVSFRRDEEGMACLSRWRDQCMDWCYYRLEDGRLGDQKYLDEWPDRYPSCHIIQHLGAGIAPWNYAQYQFGREESGGITVQGAPLIFYHFHQFQLLSDGRFERLSNFYTSECAEPILVYETYEYLLQEILDEVRGIVPNFSGGLKSVVQVSARQRAQGRIKRRIKRVLSFFIR